MAAPAGLSGGGGTVELVDPTSPPPPPPPKWRQFFFGPDGRLGGGDGGFISLRGIPKFLAGLAINPVGGILRRGYDSYRNFQSANPGAANMREGEMLRAMDLRNFDPNAPSTWFPAGDLGDPGRGGGGSDMPTNWLGPRGGGAGGGAAGGSSEPPLPRGGGGSPAAPVTDGMRVSMLAIPGMPSVPVIEGPRYTGPAYNPQAISNMFETGDMSYWGYPNVSG